MYVSFFICFVFVIDTAPPEIYTYCHTLSRHYALPIPRGEAEHRAVAALVEGLAHRAAVVGLQRRHREPDGVNDGVLRLAARRFGDVAGAQSFYPGSETLRDGLVGGHD